MVYLMQSSYLRSDFLSINLQNGAIDECATVRLAHWLCLVCCNMPLALQLLACHAQTSLQNVPCHVRYGTPASLQAAHCQASHATLHTMGCARV